jgi:hypothetical protein
VAIAVALELSAPSAAGRRPPPSPERTHPFIRQRALAYRRHVAVPIAESDADPYAAGHAARSADGGETFTAEPARDLKFRTVVDE